MSVQLAALMFFAFLWCIFTYAIAIAVMVQACDDGEYENDAPAMLKDAAITITAPASIPILMAYEYFKQKE